MKVLNLYAGIGGNRKLWEDVEVTAIELKPEIANIYQDFFPDDNVIVGDAHQYLLEHYKEYDFIWSSPPCPTHSRFNNLFNEQEHKKVLYPDMTLYQEIIYLKHWFKGNWVVENVKSYYEPLIKPYECDNHYFWSNKKINDIHKKNIRGIRTLTSDEKEKNRFNLSEFNITQKLRQKVLNNCVLPEVGLHVFKCVIKEPQKNLLGESI